MKISFPPVFYLLLALFADWASAGPIQAWKTRNPDSLNTISWTGSGWVATSSGNLMFTTADGVTWQSSIRSGSEPAGVVQLGDTLIAPGPATQCLLSRNGGANWLMRETRPSLSVKTVAGNGSIAVAIDSFGTKVTTTVDGVTWTAPASVAGLGGSALCWTGDRFVAVGKSNIAFSLDGITWTSATWSGRWLNDVTGQANGRLLAVGVQGQIGKSTDGGSTWTAIDSTIDQHLEDVAGVEGTYVAIDSNYDLHHSTDGVVWANVTPPTPSYEYWLDVGWNGTYFLAVGSGGAVAKSQDGIHWEDHSLGTNGVLNDIANGPPGFVAVGAKSLLFSPDGIAWKRLPVGDGIDWNGVGWCLDRFVVVGAGGKIGSSPDGLSWSIADKANGDYLRQVTWNGSRAVATGPLGAVYTSEDLEIWTRRTSGIPASWAGGPNVWTGTRFVAFDTAQSGGTDQRVVRSANGIDWSATADEVTNAEAMACGGGKIVAINATYRAVSVDDGESWTLSAPFSPYAFGKEIIWDGIRFIASANNAVWTSPDGTVWTNANQNTTYSINGLASTAAGYIGVSAFGNIWTSGFSDWPTASVAAVTAGEGAGSAILTASLSQATGEDTTLEFTTMPQTASEGVDYQSTSGTVVIPAGQSQASIVVPILDDAVFESSETFLVSFSSVAGGQGAHLVTGTARVTISNNDLARLYVDDLTVNEADGTAVVKIRCPDLRQPTISVVAATAADTGVTSATSGTDYVSRSATLIMPPDVNELSFAVALVDDYVPERQETFRVLLSGSTNIADGTAVVTIVDGGPGYDGWAQQQGYIFSQHSRFIASGDYDKDGNVNLVSFAMGLPINQNVATAGAAWLPAVRPPVGPSDRMTLETFVPNPLPVGVRWEVHESTDCQTWISVATATPTVDWAGLPGINIVTGEPSGGRRILTVSSSFTRETQPSGMMRMKWTQLAP